MNKQNGLSGPINTEDGDHFCLQTQWTLLKDSPNAELLPNRPYRILFTQMIPFPPWLWCIREQSQGMTAAKRLMQPSRIKPRTWTTCTDHVMSRRDGQSVHITQSMDETFPKVYFRDPNLSKKVMSSTLLKSCWNVKTKIVNHKTLKQNLKKLRDL